MPSSRQDWARAYAKQSASDFQIYEHLLAQPGVPVCHKLHYLQMACEKIAKAYQFRDMATAESKLTTSHIAFSKFINSYLTSSPVVKREYEGRDAQLIGFKKKAHSIAREIEKLAPAVDQEHSPSNAEYPWEQDNNILIPCDYSYPNLSMLHEPVGLNFLRLIKEAIINFNGIIIR